MGIAVIAHVVKKIANWALNRAIERSLGGITTQFRSVITQRVAEIIRLLQTPIARVYLYRLWLLGLALLGWRYLSARDIVFLLVLFTGLWHVFSRLLDRVPPVLSEPSKRCYEEFIQRLKQQLWDIFWPFK